MKYSIIIAAVLASVVTLNAQEAPDVDPAATFIQAIQDQSMDFIDAYDQAREAGVTRATLLTGKTLYYLRSGDLEGLLKVSADLESAKSEVDYGAEKVFVSEKQLMGLVRGLDAVKAFRDERVGLY